MAQDLLAKKLMRAVTDLSSAVDRLTFSAPTTHVYNPLAYARPAIRRYLELYAHPQPRALWLGMNPGPWGMAQTGVPFGEVELVRDWMGIHAEIGQPKVPHPRRPIEGFACERSEVSGRRLYGWARERYGTAEDFFATTFVWNYCPLIFMEESGKNRTPDKLPAEEREPLFDACDASLRKMVQLLEPEQIVGVGKFAETCAKKVLGDLGIPVGTVLHPSPASPIANRGWAAQAEQQLSKLGLLP
ncbi:Uracil DNA glycosylase superfamily protein [Planctomycetes bacterium Poly30]|uniref:Uracil DNA glycosylase superfamily protein n=1 Tax=Saltatorellus ferox TaxID=2528018 RepID=A0A518ESP5_9BACT|nr:Uracil DNA glycosylase superfamily protein [Planctomycetes bacterium Poly30]